MFFRPNMFLITVFTVFLSNSQVSFALGGESSGGGDLRAIQFKKIGELLVDIIKNSKSLPDEVKNIDWKKLKNTVETTTVESTNRKIIVNPKVVPAQVVVKDGFFGLGGKALIVFNREQWDLIPDGSRRAALVLHEYLRAMGDGSKDENYEISKYLYDDSSLRLLFNNIQQTQPITDGIDLDFMIKCKYELKDYNKDDSYAYDYNNPDWKREFAIGMGAGHYSSFHGKYIDHNEDRDEVMTSDEEMPIGLL